MDESKEFVGIVPNEVNNSDDGTSISNNESNYDNGIAIDCEKKKVPKRILQFSDGVLEEYSSDDEDEEQRGLSQVDNSKAVVDPRELTWAPFIWYQIKQAGIKTLSVCDFLGEHVADFFGITSPKYQYEIEEYFRMKTEEENERKKNLEMSVGWKEGASNEAVAIDEQPNNVDEKERY